MTEQVFITQGENSFTDRDFLTHVLHYGQLDRWVFFEKGEKTPVINSSNSMKIKEGTQVKISETIFVKWLKLNTMVDRSKSRTENFKIKRNITSIAKALGYSDTSGLYRVLQPMYEVGLIDVKEKMFNGKNTVDIIVYPYPVYSDSTVTKLLKCRSWEKRNSLGMALSKRGVKSKKDKKNEVSPVDKSPQVENEENEVFPVDKSPQVSVDKSPQVPVDKSPLSNNNKVSNKNKSSNINKSEKTESELLEEFIQDNKLKDIEIDRLKMKLSLYPSKNKNSFKAYLYKLLLSVKKEIEIEPKGQNLVIGEDHYLKSNSVKKTGVDGNQESNELTEEEGANFLEELLNGNK
ncbi:hypothetical protein RirG_002900 [Rhizophagus irregularis DAOM 197198w]|uniref:Uncharacterized protein n=1 Tax=Rhizophagus irregularis (strain DAOM 197198w) TaxID=1432141 RepID=A0A015KJC1_RHIIW|nr:hypothetical protein RirG_002900 [Rhizophagus irregularis DAOM 197198w]